MENFSDRLSELLQTEGRGAAKRLATAVGVSPAYISDLAKGKKDNPSLSLTENIAAHLGVSSSWLLTGENLSPLEKAHELVGVPTRSGVVTDRSETVELPFLGMATAGKPGGCFDFYPEEYIEVGGRWNPENHYLVRVWGQSMEPEYTDDSLIVVRQLAPGEFARKGDDVIAIDSDGVVLKRLIYSRNKSTEEADSPLRTFPHLISVNPEYPEHVPCGTDTPIRGVVVAKLDLEQD